MKTGKINEELLNLLELEPGSPRRDRQAQPPSRHVEIKDVKSSSASVLTADTAQPHAVLTPDTGSMRSAKTPTDVQLIFWSSGECGGRGQNASGLSLCFL